MAVDVSRIGVIIVAGESSVEITPPCGSDPDNFAVVRVREDGAAQLVKGNSSGRTARYSNFGAACNDWVRRSDVDYVVIGSEDVFAGWRRFLAELEAFNFDKSSFICVCCEDQTSCLIETIVVNRIQDVVEAFFGAHSIIFDRRLFLLHGGFDENLDAFSIVDLGIRLSQLGHSIYRRRTQKRSRRKLELAMRVNPAGTLTSFVALSHKHRHESKLGQSIMLSRLGSNTAKEMLLDYSSSAYAELLEREARRCFQPLVSIIIPVYNGSDYLREAILSALAQTYSAVEVIVVNDGSDDDGATARIAAEFRGRIRYIEKENGGVASALNAGIKQMQGAYFSWLSHDDLYVPEKIEIQIARLAECNDPDKCIVYSDFVTFGPGVVEVHHAISKLVVPSFRYFLTAHNALHGCTLLVPKSAFDAHGLFRTDLQTTQDFDKWFTMASSYEFVYIPRILTKARIHDSQGTRRLADIVVHEIDELYQNFVSALQDEEIITDTSASIRENWLRLARNLEDRGALRASLMAEARAAEAGEKLAFDLTDPPQSETGQLYRENQRLQTEIEQLRSELEIVRNSRFIRLALRAQRLIALRRVRGWRR